MNKRKKAPSSASRSARNRSNPGPSKAVGAARAKSNGTRSPGPPKTTLALTAECLVSDARSLKERLAALVGEPGNVTLDASALQRIDTAALQVIAAFVRERTDFGHTVEWQGSAPVLATAAQLLGLTTLLRLPA